ncbi:hypothetical protein DV737_g1983, partial [Chaetothyriales sp. CBS 132003]
MAPRIPPNHYDTIDFTSLALQYPVFARKLKPNGQLDFSDPESVRQLTICLLDRDFGLTVTLPPDRLCPPVPNRFNYILFLQRLLDSTSPSFRDSHDPTRSIVGIDIGTGASAIYPLLGTRQFANWTFLATEIDETSRTSAAENISRNGLADRIKLLDNNKSPLLIPTKALFPENAAGKIDFLMTNPPFYASTAEMAASAKLKARPPNSSCTGSTGEMVYQYRGDFPPTTTTHPTLGQALSAGGEVAFTAQLIHESTWPALRHRIQWFSAMLGKLSSLPPLISLVNQFHARLHRQTPPLLHSDANMTTAPGANYAVAEFIQGQKTRRWCIAWSWMPLRPPVSLARGIPALEKRLLPMVSEFEFAFAVQSVAAVSAAVNEVMQGLVAEANHYDNDDDDNDDSDGDEIVISVKHEMTNTKRVEEAARGKAETVVRARWMQGIDGVLFESFCGWLKRKVESKVKSSH